MFEYIRTHQKLMQFLLLLVILPGFALFGLQGYNGMVDDPTAPAKVCGAPLSLSEFSQAMQEQMDTMRQQLGPNFHQELFDNPQIRAGVLDRLVNDRALTCGALKRNIMFGDDRVRRTIMNLPGLQVNGQFSKERYDMELLARGWSSPMFDDRVRQSLVMAALTVGVADSAFTPQTVQNLVARSQEEQREVQDFVLKPDGYAAQVKIAPEAVKAYYDANQREFQVPPQVKVEYAVLSLDTLAATLVPPPEEIRAYYDQNQAKYGQPEQRQASHILIKVEDPKAKAAAQAKAEEVLKLAQAPGADFAALAKKYSQDPGSGANGGDLGMFGRGAMVKPFEDAVYQLKQGETSGLVESEFGYHIIKLTAIKPGSVKPFEEVRGEIEKDWKKQRAQKLYGASAEGFKNMVYEQPDSLKAAADKYKLTVQTTPFFVRGAAPKELNYPKLLDGLFSDDSIKSKHNTDAVETSIGNMVSARVLEYKPQSILPFEEAKARITAQLTQKESRAMARQEGAAKLKAALASLDAVSFGPAKTISRAKPEGIAPEAVKAVMAAKADKLPAVVGVELPDGSYGLYRVNKVSQPDKPDPAEREGLKKALARVESEADFDAYQAAMRASAKVEMHPERLETKSNQ